MRRLTAALAATATALGLALVVAQPAEATITSPAVGSIQRGTVTLSDTGATDTSSLCAFGGSAPQTQVRVFNAANVAVFNQTKAGAGAASFTFDTHTVPNGAYRLQTDLRNKKGTIICSNSTELYNAAFTISNGVDITVSVPASGAQNTSVPVSATLNDLSNGAAVSGLPVSISLSGGGTVTGTTNAAGVVSGSLSLGAPPRAGAVLTATTVGNTFWAANTVTRTLDVTKNASVVTLAQPAPITHGESLNFSATVAAGNGTGTPSGTVQFTLDGNNYGSPVNLVGGAAATPVASSLNAPLTTGTHTVGAEYSGDTNFVATNAATKNAVINKATTTTTLDAAPTPTVSGQQVTFTAQVDVVTPGGGAPTGGVQFNVDGNPFGTAIPVDGSGEATLSISNLTTGNHNVEAVYNGDADFKSSSSATITHGVNKADSNLALTSSDLTAVSGQPLTYTAVVTAGPPGAGTPTGSVQFEVDGQPLGAPVPLVGGQATSSIAHLLVGNHNVTANYTGDANFGGSNNSVTQAVAPGATTTSVSSSPNPSVFGQQVTLRGEVTPVAPATGTPTGAIRFVVDGATLAIVEPVNGVAEFQTTALAVGSHPVTAKFLSDDINFTPSSSSEISQVVNRAATKTVLSSSASNSVFGQPVTFTADVSVLAPGAGSPSGTITFADGSTVLDTVPVNSGTGFAATYTTDDLTVGQHAITATYSGDGSFTGSNASTTQTVQKASTSVVVTSSNNPSLTGQPTVFSAAVSPVAPGAGAPSGTVLFTLNGLPLGGQRPLTDGVATSPSFSALTPGTYKVKAQYSGDGNFFKSDSLLDQGAGQGTNKGATSMTLGATPATAGYNDPVTFSTTVSAVAPATGKPSGVVRFWQGGELLGSSSLVPAGSGNSSSATFVSTTLSPGAHAVRAEYVGNFNFTAAEANTSVTVGRAPTTTGVSSSANPAAFGSTVNLTATVNKALPAAGDPTGSVTFKEGAATLGTGTISTVGGQQVASITVSGLSGGAHPVTAVYSGDVTFSGSTSAAFTQNVSSGQVTLVAGSPVSGSPLGTRNGYVRAKLTDQNGNPMVGKTISFTNKPFGSRPAYHLCSAVTNASGLAECDYTVINIDPATNGEDLLIDVNGDYDATYAGSADYLPATARGHLF